MRFAVNGTWLTFATTSDPFRSHHEEDKGIPRLHKLGLIGLVQAAKGFVKAQTGAVEGCGVLRPVRD